ncbi:hypothetical protein DL96DRAFT_880260 [Flagelloscypha sp. PMI_526]|nr:hypothetical protein DL96DRAFT_880260 [Flagelloscypha sp. PMI_526]
MTTPTPTNLPIELWRLIAECQSTKTLRSLKKVNRLCYIVANEVFSRILDLAPSEPNAESRLASLTHQLNVASANPLAIQVVRLPAHLYVLPSRKESESTASHSLVVEVLNYFLQMRSKTLISRVQEAQNCFCDLLPSLTAAGRLYIADQYTIEHGPPNNAIQLTYTLFSPRLTLLSVQMSSRSALQTCFPEPIPSLPALNVFRLRICSYEAFAPSIHSRLRRLLYHSHLLREIEYSTQDKSLYLENFDTLWYPEEPSRHPHLRIFNYSVICLSECPPDLEVS